MEVDTSRLRLRETLIFLQFAARLVNKQTEGEKR